MHFAFVLELSNIDLWNIDFLGTHLDLLDTVSPVSILFVSVMSSRRLQDMSSRHLQNMSSRHVFKISWKHLQRNIFLSSKTSSRLLVRRKIVTLKTCWRRFQDMSWRRLQDQQMFVGKRLRHRFFLVNFAKRIFARKLHWRYSTGL